MFVAMVSLCTCRGSSWEMVLVRLRVGVIWMLSVADGVDHGDADKATRSGIGHVTGEDLRCQGSQAMQENRGGSLVSVKSSNARIRLCGLEGNVAHVFLDRCLYVNFMLIRQRQL